MVGLDWLEVRTLCRFLFGFFWGGGCGDAVVHTDRVPRRLHSPIYIFFAFMLTCTAIPMISLHNKGEYVVTAICVNSKDEPTKFGEEQCKGVSSIEGAPHRWSGTQMGAFLKLEKGQVVRMGWLPNFDAQGWNVRQQTTFSGIRLGDAPQRDDGKSPNGVVGFHAHKKAEQKVEKGWDKLTNYRASGWHGTY